MYDISIEDLKKQKVSLQTPVGALDIMITNHDMFKRSKAIYEQIYEWFTSKSSYLYLDYNAMIEIKHSVEGDTLSLSCICPKTHIIELAGRMRYIPLSPSVKKIHIEIN